MRHNRTYGQPDNRTTGQPDNRTLFSFWPIETSRNLGFLRGIMLELKHTLAQCACESSKSLGVSTQVGVTRVVSVRLAFVQGFLRLVGYANGCRFATFYASVYDCNFPSLVASLFSWRCPAASSSSSLHAAINLRPPSVTALTQTSAFNAIVFQSPVMPNAGCRSVHSRSTLSPSHPVLSALRPQGFSTRVWFSSLVIPDVCMVFDYGKQVYTTILLLLCCRRALLLLSAPVILMMKQLPSDTPETMQQRAFAVCCIRCPCPCLHAWVVFHRL